MAGPTASSRARKYLGRWSVMRHHRERRARATRARRWTVRSLVVLLILAVVPVPWLHVVDENPPGWAWRLDGRLVVDGEVMEPEGRWSWLTVGRPPLLIEAAHDELIGTENPARDMRTGPVGSRPAQSEPVAAAVGMREAGRHVPMEILVEVSGPQEDGLPQRAVLVEIDGRPLSSRADVRAAAEMAGETVHVVTAEGDEFAMPGPDLPYDDLRILDIAPPEITAAIGGPLSRLAPVAWFRSLSLGSSHGMMVALLTYAHLADEDLARGRHIAGTGGIRGDGTVTRIGGLPAKAHAAHRARADVLFFPAEQAGELAGFTSDRMVLVPIATLADAIEYLAAEDPQEPGPAGSPAGDQANAGPTN